MPETKSAISQTYRLLFCLTGSKKQQQKAQHSERGMCVRQGRELGVTHRLLVEACVLGREGSWVLLFTSRGMCFRQGRELGVTHCLLVEACVCFRQGRELGVTHRLLVEACVLGREGSWVLLTVY